MPINRQRGSRSALDITQEVRQATETLCPLARAARLSAIAHQRGNLPGRLAHLRKLALIEARQAGHAVKTIAAELDLSPARISQLTAAALRKVA